MFVTKSAMIVLSKVYYKIPLSSFVLCFSVVLQIVTFSHAAFVPQSIQKNILLNPQAVTSFGHQNGYFSAKKGDGINDDDKNSEDESPSWLLPSGHPESAARRARMVRLHEEMQRFVHGSELQNLRNDVVSLKASLQKALATDNISRIVDLYSAIESAQDKDPEFVYSKILNKIANAQTMNVRKKYKLLPKYTEEALAVRKYIPRLNMEGLWIGNFGTEGSQLINVTYTGDTLIATKITGECQVTKGEIVFRANLFPNTDEEKDSKSLDPIPLNESAASKWNIKKLDRYAGEGQIASESTHDSKFVDGQLIMFDGYFSFLYLPSKQHIFFSRPSPQLITHLMKDVIDIDDELQNMKDHVERCFNKDIDEDFVEPRIEKKRTRDGSRDIQSSLSDILKMDQSNKNGKEVATMNAWIPLSLKLSSSRKESKFSFWGFHKWMGYIDSVLKPQNKKDGFS